MEAFGRIWALGCTSLLIYGAFEMVRGAQNCSKLPNIRRLLSTECISLSKNLVLNTFSGSTNLWRLLGEYGHLGVLLC